MPSNKRTRSASPASQHLGPRAKKQAVATHDIDDFQVFANDLAVALAKVLPSGRLYYTRAAILTIHFSHTDPKVVPLRENLLKTLKNLYNFEARRYVIDGRMHWTESEQLLQNELEEFKAQYGNNVHRRALLVVYYSGHAMKSEKDPSVLNLFGAHDTQGRPVRPIVNWNKASAPLFNSQANHFLCIFGSCDAGLATFQSRVELLAAATCGTSASSMPSTSFTQLVINALEATKGKEITAAHLLGWITYQCQTTLKTAQPIHLMAADPEIPSALFHRIGPETSGSSVSVENVGPSGSRAHVMLKVCLKNPDTLPDAKQWEQWLGKNMPPNIGRITIKGKWIAGSIAALVVIPFELWLYIADRLAYENMGPYLGGWEDLDPARGLQERPRGAENIPFSSGGNRPGLEGASGGAFGEGSGSKSVGAGPSRGSRGGTPLR